MRDRLLEGLTRHGCLEISFAIYGIGGAAKALIDNLPGLTITGLMDKNPGNTGKTIYGFNVLSYDDVIAKAER